jgi:hypothetical protein
MLNVDAVGIDAGVDTRAGGLQRLAGDRALGPDVCVSCRSTPR